VRAPCQGCAVADLTDLRKASTAQCHPPRATLPAHDRSSSFLDRRSLLRCLDFAHVFRKAIDNCSLRGAYLLADSATGARNAPTPVVYVAEAVTDDAASKIHRLVWNQGVVPFLIVRTPLGVRVYSGFAYSQDKNRTDVAHTGILRQSASTRQRPFASTSERMVWVASCRRSTRQNHAMPACSHTYKKELLKTGRRRSRNSWSRTGRRISLLRGPLAGSLRPSSNARSWPSEPITFARRSR